MEKIKEFKREQKYLVMKLDDLKVVLDDTYSDDLDTICKMVSDYHRKIGKKENSYVVVNEDEPYAEKVWELIKNHELNCPLPDAPEWLDKPDSNGLWWYYGNVPIYANILPLLRIVAVFIDTEPPQGYIDSTMCNLELFQGQISEGNYTPTAGGEIMNIYMLRVDLPFMKSGNKYAFDDETGNVYRVYEDGKIATFPLRIALGSYLNLLRTENEKYLKLME